MTTFKTIGTEIINIECCRCAATVWLSSKWVEMARNAGGFLHQFYCPYCGNRQGWGQSQHEKQLARATADAAFLRERLTKETAKTSHLEASRNGLRGSLTKIKKRIGRGVCPCCNRSFENLRRHMESKHPETTTQP